MIITRGEVWYRPYKVIASGRNYFLDKIVFFEKDGIMVENRNGWLENERGIDLPEFYLPVESLKVKRKATLSTDEPYLISLGKDYTKENKAILYVPMHMVNLHLEKYEIVYGYQLRAIYKGEQNIHFDVFIKALNGELTLLSEEYERAYKDVEHFQMRTSTREEVMERIDNLKSIADRYHAEKERLDNLTMEEALKEAGIKP